MAATGIDGRFSTITLGLLRIIRDANDAARDGKGSTEFKRPHLNAAVARDPELSTKPIDAALGDAVNTGLIDFDPEFGNLRISMVGRELLDSQMAKSAAETDEDAAMHDDAVANRERDEKAYREEKARRDAAEKSKDRR